MKPPLSLQAQRRRCAWERWPLAYAGAWCAV